MPLTIGLIYVALGTFLWIIRNPNVIKSRNSFIITGAFNIVLGVVLLFVPEYKFVIQTLSSMSILVFAIWAITSFTREERKFRQRMKDMDEKDDSK